jgi:DNA-binding transcriptional ArsR family regulator
MTYANALTALADPTRRTVFERLKRGPKSVGDIADGLPVSRPAVSQHLKVLKEARLVTAYRDGTGFWGDALAAFKAFAEKDAPKRRARRRRRSR